jgi:hypothetical protein
VGGNVDEGLPICLEENLTDGGRGRLQATHAASEHDRKWGSRREAGGTCLYATGIAPHSPAVAIVALECNQGAVPWDVLAVTCRRTWNDCDGHKATPHSLPEAVSHARKEAKCGAPGLAGT